MHHSCIENAIDQFDKPNLVSPISKEILTKYEKITFNDVADNSFRCQLWKKSY